MSIVPLTAGRTLVNPALLSSIALAITMAKRWPWRHAELRNDGLGFDRIAQRLNSEGIPTRTGRPWHGFVVNHILGG